MYSLNSKVGQAFLFPDKGRGQSDYVPLHYHQRTLHLGYSTCFTPKAHYSQASCDIVTSPLLDAVITSELTDWWSVVDSGHQASLWHQSLDRDSDKIKHFREYLIWTPGITVSLDLLHTRVWVMIAFWKFLSGQLWLDCGDPNKVLIGGDWHMPQTAMP